MLDPIKFENQVANMPPQSRHMELQKIMGLLKRNPRNTEMYYASGVLMMHLGMYEDAFASFRKVLKLNKGYEPAFAKITELLITKMKRFGEASQYYKKWLAIRKNSTAILTRLARCQISEHKYEEALQTAKRAGNLDPKDPVVQEIYSVIHSAMGNEEATKKALEKCAELGGNLEITSRILNLPGNVPDDSSIEKFVKISEGMEDSLERSHLFTNIALAYEKRKEYEKAFDYFERANERGQKKLDKQRALSAFASVKEAFSPEYLASHANEGNATNKPVFIVGMPRSGTTLIESILAAHPEIEDNGELPFIQEEMKKMGLERPSNPVLAQQTPTLKDQLDQAPEGAFKMLAERYMNESGFNHQGGYYQVDKLPHNFMSVGLIHLMFPNARIIHSRRNPVDGGLSCYKSSFSEFHSYATDLEFLGEYYRNYWELMDYWREVLPGKMLEVFYEDTVTNTEHVARKMIDFIGLEWDDRCLDHTRSKKTVQTASQWQVRQPIYTSSIAKWKNYEAQLQPMITSMGEIVSVYEQEIARIG